MLNSDELRFAIEDARARHAAIVELIYATDRQAMALLSFYVTLGLAAASGFVAGLTPESIIPNELAWALFSAVVVFLLGAFQCFRVMESTFINLPGRTAKFWIWADDPAITSDDAYREYLRNLDKKHALNNDASHNASVRFGIAKQIGVVAPIMAAVVGFSCHVLAPLI